jgi:hypothetical protein
MRRKEEWQMGKFFGWAGIFLIALTVNAIADDSINPMVWPRDQWRSDLFDSYSQSTRKRSTYRHERHLVRAVNRIVIENNGEKVQPILRRARLIRIGGDVETGVAVNSVQEDRPRCSGILILTWTGSGTTSRCHRGSATLRQ